LVFSFWTPRGFIYGHTYNTPLILEYQHTGTIYEIPNKKYTTDETIYKDWLTFYLIKGNGKPYNTNVKLKEVDFNFLIQTLKHILPNIQITIKIT